MVLGFVDIDRTNGTINTHRDSYVLENLSVFSVRRPFLPAGLLFGVGFAGFALVFGDLLYGHEMLLALTGASIAMILGAQVGQLKLLSRDLRGSELADAVWGRYADLNRIRREIVDALHASRSANSTHRRAAS